MSAHLMHAKSQGWEVGRGMALVDNWRNEYELTKGDNKTVMRFDMRPSLFGDSALNLTALTLIAGSPKLEAVIRRFAACKSWPEAFAAEGLHFIEASVQTMSKQIAASATDRENVSDIAYDYAKRTFYWNQAAAEKYSNHKVRLVGERWAFDMPRNDLSFLLISAKGDGWTGADNLFNKPRVDVITLKLKDDETIKSIRCR